MKVIAIVIGNNNYYEPYKLNNAVNDATSMADVFYRLGYTVVSEYDCDNKKHEDTVSLSVSERSFKKRDPSLWTSPEKFVVLGDQT